MEFTPLEMLAINAIAGYDEIFGLPFNIANKKEEDLFLSLENKDIVKNKSLTDIGTMMAFLFEKYNEASTHLFINRSRMALDDDSVIAFVKEENTINVIRKHKVKAIEDIVMENRFLKLEQKKSFFVPQPVPCSEEKWFEEEIDKFPNYLLIQKFENKDLVKHIFLAWSDTKGCCYDCRDNRMLEMGARDIRIALLELFDVEGAKDNGI